MEEEAREILRTSLTRRHSAPRDLAEPLKARFEGLGGVELELPARDQLREPPSLDR
jgi:plasmid stability protein